MATEAARIEEVRQTIDNLIQIATSYDIATLDQIYHEDLHVIMVDNEGQVHTADKAAFKGLFQAKRDAGEPPMNTWARYHLVEASGDKGHVVLSRKNNLNGTDMELFLSIDLVYQDGRWQVIREVISLRPDLESA